ncbi:hypothetical protein [Neobacillus ginsengisoli]|uniref:ABC transporter permease n=1 Tax=Neobacillus ginsengisoli TaxID=904295 RepID=A0ABT9Y217_9BACI|nr:hypothetical protein [Neobacillus ginsengisoli]MDQ0201857.1 hypothetical protein [Neobacillus ginsengisoli]
MIKSMEVVKVIKLMELEWRKLKQKTVISEIIIYCGIIMFLPMFFIKMVNVGFGQSYSTIIQLIL